MQKSREEQEFRQAHHGYKNASVYVRESRISLLELSNDHLIEINHLQAKPRPDYSPAKHDY